MKFAANYFIGLVLAVLSIFIFKVDDSLLYAADKQCQVADSEVAFNISSIGTHNDIIVPDNNVNLFNTAARRLSSNGNILFKSNFIQEQNETYFLKTRYQHGVSLSAINKPQTYYYVYTLRKIRI